LLRVGILLDSAEVSCWIADIIHEINRNKHLQLSVIICPDGAPTKNPKNAYALYRKIDSALLPGKPNVLAKVKLALPKTSLLTAVISAIGTISMRPQDLQEIKQHDVGILLHFGRGMLDETMLTLWKYGVWCLQAGEGIALTNNSAGFWEWYHKTPITKISLVKLNGSTQRNEYIASSLTKTEYLSLSRNQTAIFSKGIDLLLDTLVRLSTSGSFTQTTGIEPVATGANTNPGIIPSLAAFGKLIVRAWVKSITKLFFIEQWVLFYSFSPSSIPQLDFRNFKPLIPPKHLIWADPFVISENNKHYLFIEELETKTNKGHISCMVLNKEGEIETSAIIINQPYHLSYPFIFKHEETWYMIPESAENSTVDLYECLEFPFTWKFKKSIFTHVRALDTTLHVAEGKFWLFCTIQKRLGASTNDDLYVFYTDDFLSDVWTPLSGNPVLSDPSSARPAGRIFYHDQAWYRPSQICVPRYGYGLSLNRITKLDESIYCEENVTQVLPRWTKNLLSVHTLNFSNDHLMIIDGQIKRFKYFD
jgi:hypothetical protein